MNTKTLNPELLHKIDAYWRAANYLSVGQIHLADNPLLKRPLELTDVKQMLLGRDHRAPWSFQLLRGIHPHYRFDVQPARQVVDGHRASAVAAQDRLAELPADLARLASGS